MTTAIRYIDELEYVRKAKELRDPEALAEYQIKQIESAIDASSERIMKKVHNNNKDLTTKSDLILIKDDTTLLKADNNILKSDISTLKSDTNILKTDVSILKNDVNILKSDVRVLKDDVATLKVDLAELKNDVIFLKTDLFLVKREVIHTKEELKQDLLVVENKLSSETLLLRKDMEAGFIKANRDMIKFVVWTGVFVVFTLTMVMAQGFHWL